MKKITLLSFIICTLFIGSTSAFGQEVTVYTTGFEAADGFVTSTTYNNATPAIFGSTQSWSAVMGAVSTTSPVTGSQSMQMRSYANNTTLGFATMNFDLPYVTKVTFNALAYNSATTSLNAYYSTDYGVTWSSATSITVSTTKSLCTYTVSATGAYKAVRIKIENPTNNVAGRLTIDDVTVYGMTPANPLAVTPVFSVASGKYITQQNVTLTTTTPNASIYYTTDGSNPTDASTLYSSPIAVNSTKTIKAIAYASGFEESLLSMASYTLPTEVASVASLRVADPSGFYKLTGEVVLTYVSPGTYSKPRFVQDATAGIVIYDSGSKITSTYNINDGITGLIGTLSTYNGMLELVPVADAGTATSTGNTVTPIAVTLATLANYPSQLVKVNNVTITIPSGATNFVAKTAYVINDLSTAGVLRTAYSDLPYITTAIPSTAQDIVGVVYNYSTTESDLLPRSASDMVDVVTGFTNPSSTAFNAFVSGKKLLVNNVANGSTVEIYSVLGSKVQSSKLMNGSIEMNNLTKGLYIVRVGKNIQKIML